MDHVPSGYIYLQFLGSRKPIPQNKEWNRSMVKSFRESVGVTKSVPFVPDVGPSSASIPLPTIALMLVA